MDSESLLKGSVDELDSSESNSATIPDQLDYAAWIGIDWADKKHDVCMRVAGQSEVERLVVMQNPEAMHEWIDGLRVRFGGRPIAVCLEQTRGAIMSALVQNDFLVLYPVNPQSLAKFRRTFCVSGAKSDTGDCFFLMDLLHRHCEQLTVWKPGDGVTRALGALCESRRNTVAHRTACTNQLQSQLKIYYPQALQLCGDDLYRPLALKWLRRFPTLQAAQKVRLSTVESFYRVNNCRSSSLIAGRLEIVKNSRAATNDNAVIEPAVLVVLMLVGQLEALNKAVADFDEAIDKWFKAHPDTAVFKSLPGAGAAMAPRLLAAFGSDRTRFSSAEEAQCYAGVAPITVQSGKSKSVQRRFFFPRFQHQTFHEYAGCSIKHCAWAKAFYAGQRAKGKSHHTAIRALAFKWMRIIWRMWQDQTLYDDAKYLESLTVAKSPLAA